MSLRLPIYIIIHQTHYEKSDWSRAFNQFTIACELDMINVISASDIAFIMSCVLLRNKMAERSAYVCEDELCEKCIIKQSLNSVFASLLRSRSGRSHVTLPVPTRLLQTDIHSFLGNKPINVWLSFSCECSRL